METLWKCAVLGLTASLLALAFRKQNEEQALLLGIGAAVLILLAALPRLGELMPLLRRAEERSGLTAEFTVPVLKCLGLSLLGKFSAGFCRDLGQSSTAAALELASVCAILCVSVPLLKSLMDIVFAYT